MNRRHARREQEDHEDDDDDEVVQDVDIDQVKELVEDDSSDAQKIVRELYFRYEKQIQRWKDYRNLFLFLAFTAWYLATLYLQRQADVSYQVYSTLDSVMTPSFKQTQDKDDVYVWLDDTLQAIWVDSICGDGVCDNPWEFPSYSSFGCRADCGRMKDTMNLTTIQLDLYWDFSHAAVSIPAALLLNLAKWNLCPVTTNYNYTCYYTDSFGVAQDQSFASMAGNFSATLSDVPDGVWDVVTKQDTFNKISGAVRDVELLGLVSYYYKTYIAAVSAKAQQTLETAMLQQVITLSSLPLFEYIKQNITAANDNTTETDFQLQQLINASCACDGLVIDPSSPNLWGQAVYLALNNTVNYFDTTQLNNITSVAMYQSTYCSSLVVGGPATLWDAVDLIVFANGTIIEGPVSNPSDNYTTVTGFQLATNTVATCSTLLTSLLSWRNTMTAKARMLIYDNRIGDGKTTGIVAALNNVTNDLTGYITQNLPELYGPVFTDPAGTVALQAPLDAGLQYMQLLYITGVTYSSQPAPASLALSRSFVYNGSITLPALANRAKARINEIMFQQGEVNSSINVAPPDPAYPNNLTVKQLLDIFTSAGATDAVLPTSDAAALGQLTTVYNLVAWDGNTTAYLQCSLSTRAPEFVGTCNPMAVLCTPTTNDTSPFNCSTNDPVNATVAGNVSVAAYRLACEIPCTRWQDCNTVCECFSSCSSSEACVCDACMILSSDALNDNIFVDMLTATEASTTGIVDVSGDSGRRRRKMIEQRALHVAATVGTTSEIVDAWGSNDSKQREMLQERAMHAAIGSDDDEVVGGVRRLLDVDVAAQLATVLTQATALQVQQDGIISAMAALQSSIDTTNAASQATLSAGTLESLVTSGRTDIQTGHSNVLSKLNVIIGQQDQSLALAQAQASSMTSTQQLAIYRQQAEQSIQAGLSAQYGAIKSALFATSITATQALLLFKLTRRNGAVAMKTAKLANIPCNVRPNSDHNYILNSTGSSVLFTPRQLDIGLTNRVIAGMLLHQTRTYNGTCTPSKFSALHKICDGEFTADPFGIDPVFKLGTTLYNPSLNDNAGEIVLEYHSCEGASNDSYNVSPRGKICNLEPYCAQQYNCEGAPFAFDSFPLANKDPGFPVWFDINLGSQGADNFFRYISEGLYIDDLTLEMTAELIIYNPQLKIFGYTTVTFKFTNGGSIMVSSKIQTVRIELYNSYDDDVRFFLEIVLNLWISCMLLSMIWDIITFHREQGNALRWFMSGWNLIEFMSNSLLFGTMIMWWIFVQDYAKTFRISLRYNVYKTLIPTADYLDLEDNGVHLTDAYAAFSNLKALIEMLNLYFCLNGFSILLVIARILKRMDFQPRLGVVTRSMWHAGSDLLHFAVVAGLVFVSYAMMAHLIFGNAIEEFRTFNDSVNYCFEMLLGNVDVHRKLHQLGGVLSIAGELFFWTYELFVYLVLLNFLLAIIVDAFAKVKEETQETIGVHTELFQLLRDKWRGLLGRCSSTFISDDQLGALLKQWAGVEGNVVKEARNTGPRRLHVADEELKEEDVKAMMLTQQEKSTQQNLRGSDLDLEERGSQFRGRAKAQLKSLMPRRVQKLFGKDARLVVSPKEVSAAAKLALARFGDPGPGSEDEAEEVAEGEVEETPVEMEEKEHDQLAQALERLAKVQKELAKSQGNLTSAQSRLTSQQDRLLTLVMADRNGRNGAES